MKSEIEKRFDVVSKKYMDTFGKNYPLVITDMRKLDEHIAIMEKCIMSGKEAKKPKYKAGADY